MIDAFGVEHVAKAGFDKRRQHEVEAAGGTAAAANEGRAIYQNKHTGRVGQTASAKPHHGGFRNIPGISDAPAGTHFSQASHPEGVYNISTASLARARQKPAPRRGQDQLRDTLRTKGFDRPVHMHIWEDGKARIWDGHHRTTRAAELGLDRVPVSVTHVKGNRPRPKSVTEGLVELRHHRYRQGLMQAAKLAKGTGMEISKKRLTAAERNALPDSAFADPKHRRFPMNDKAHAANALARANQGFAGKKLKAKIKAKERKMLHKSAFGVEHAEPLEKGIGSILESAGHAFQGFKGGVTNAGPKVALKGLPKAAKAETGAGARGYRAGKFVRSNAKPLSIGAGVGGGLGLAAMGSRKNY